MKATFEIVTCTSGHVDFVDFDVPAEFTDWDDFDLCIEFVGEVLSAAGLTNYKCDGCYDSAYRVKFVGWVVLDV